jgi:hypothetical protein
MKLIANMPVRNADWVLGLSTRAALLWCDELVMLLHACTDRSAEIAAEIAKEYPGRVRIIEEAHSDWQEMVFRQRMLDTSRKMGATHVAITDSDEILTGNLLPIIRSGISATPTDHICSTPLYNLRDGIHRYHANGTWGRRIVTMAFADSPRLHWLGDRWHHREPMGAHPDIWCQLGQQDGGVMHLWGASERRLKAHHAHYKLTERLRWPDKSTAEIDRMYSWCVRGVNNEAATWTYADVPPEWWAPYRNWMEYLDVDAEPWEEAECRRIVAEYEYVRCGLDLFGVV